MQRLDNSLCMSCSSCWPTGQVQSCIELHHSNWEKKTCDEDGKKEALFSAPSAEESGLLSSPLLHVMWEPRVLREVSRLPPVRHRRGGHKGIPAHKAPCQPRDAQRGDWPAIKGIPERESGGSWCPLACPPQFVGEKENNRGVKKKKMRGGG